MDGKAHVRTGGDRFLEQRKVFGSRTIDLKVSSLDTNGGPSIMGITDVRKGGPSRHFHHEQEEWFYVVEGEYTIEIDDERYELGPGDSVLAPRGVPHVRAHVVAGTGRMLIVPRPAGRMEPFFGGLAKGRACRSARRSRGCFVRTGWRRSDHPWRSNRCLCARRNEGFW